MNGSYGFDLFFFGRLYDGCSDRLQREKRTRVGSDLSEMLGETVHGSRARLRHRNAKGTVKPWISVFQKVMVVQSMAITRGLKGVTFFAQQLG